MFKIQYPWKYKWKHGNLFLIFLSTSLAVYMLTAPEIVNFIENTGGMGYLGALIAGFFFSSLFTTPIATAVLIILGKTLDPLVIAAIGAFGAATADMIIYSAAKKSIENLSVEINELKLFMERHNPVHVNAKNKLFHEIKMHTAPVLAGFIIASPLPDELAVGLLGAAHYNKKKTVVLSYIANFIGIMALAYMGKASI